MQGALTLHERAAFRHLDRRLAAAGVTMFLLAVAMANPRSQAHISGDGDNRSMQLRRRVQTD